jgi:nitroimidazol reductase NimA-like FMN-containing flavoprotein (pyridoxamine 5'-phosphate oxidase superfamily)
MHKLRINISDKLKIMINSPEVCFDITREHEEVGHKNIIIFGYKNHLGSFYRNGKQFI